MNTDNLNISADVIYSLKDVLTYFKQEIQLNNISTSGVVKIKIRSANLDFLVFDLPALNLDDLFDNFLEKFKHAFEKDFDSCTFTDFRFMDSFSIKISSKEYVSNPLRLEKFTAIHQLYFRKLVCLSFGVLLNLKIDVCACFPQTTADFIAWKAGINMNCISGDCKEYLRQHPHTLDSLFVGDCTDTYSQISIVSANLFAPNGNIKFNLNIVQKIKELIAGEVTSTD